MCHCMHNTLSLLQRWWRRGAERDDQQHNATTANATPAATNDAAGPATNDGRPAHDDAAATHATDGKSTKHIPQTILI